MKNIYYKSQIFYSLIAIGFFSVSLFYFVQNNPKNENVKLVETRVISKQCSAAPRSSSSIMVKEKSIIYTVKLPEKHCVLYSKGDLVKLYYNLDYDFFFYPENNGVYKFRFWFCGMTLILSALPWKKIRTYLKQKRMMASL